jgi:hypothetical protein
VEFNGKGLFLSTVKDGLCGSQPLVNPRGTSVLEIKYGRESATEQGKVAGSRDVGQPPRRHRSLNHGEVDVNSKGASNRLNLSVTIQPMIPVLPYSEDESERVKTWLGAINNAVESIEHGRD